MPGNCRDSNYTHKMKARPKLSQIQPLLSQESDAQSVLKTNSFTRAEENEEIPKVPPVYPSLVD